MHKNGIINLIQTFQCLLSFAPFFASPLTRSLSHRCEGIIINGAATYMELFFIGHNRIDEATCV